MIITDQITWAKTSVDQAVRSRAPGRDRVSIATNYCGIHTSKQLTAAPTGCRFPTAWLLQHKKQHVLLVTAHTANGDEAGDTVLRENTSDSKFKPEI